MIDRQLLAARLVPANHRRLAPPVLARIPDTRFGRASSPARSQQSPHRRQSPINHLASRVFVDELASARIGETFNQYRGSRLRRERLIAYLERLSHAPFLLVGEAPGYRGARISGIPFTSERQLTGSGPSEATATLVQRILAELGLAESVLLWNVVPTHPGTATSNRTPTSAEIAAGLPFVRELGQGRRIVAVGRLAHAALGGLHVRHPSHGGARAFRDGLIELLDQGHLAPDPP